MIGQQVIGDAVETEDIASRVIELDHRQGAMDGVDHPPARCRAAPPNGVPERFFRQDHHRNPAPPPVLDQGARDILDIEGMGEEIEIGVFGPAGQRDPILKQRPERRIAERGAMGMRPGLENPDHAFPTPFRPGAGPPARPV